MTITAEQRAKAQETQRKLRESWSQQTIVIDKDWKIIRSDELNWEIRYKGKPQGFYSTIVAALKVLPAKMLSEVAKGDLATIVAQQKAIVEQIERHFPA